MIEVFKRNWGWFIIPICIIIIYGGLIIFKIYPFSEFSIEKAGQFGDSFGIINTLFSGSAFIALVITIYLQQQDIRETKKEVQKQNFENTFFKMIELYNNVEKDLILDRPKVYTGIFSHDGIEEFSYTNYKIGEKSLFIGEKDYKGKEVINELLKIFKFYKILIDKKSIRFKDGIYEDFHNEYEYNIGHYFGTIYQVLKFIDNSSIDNKDFYSNLFRAQFSKRELELLFYHSTSRISKKKFTPLLIKYEFFEHLDIDKVDDRAIEILINETKKLELNYPLHKIFGENIKSKDKISKFINEKHKT